MIIGNLTRDPEARSTATGQAVCNFSVATSMQWTNPQGQRQERTEYHAIVAWGKLADICQQYLMKGRKVYVEGRLQTREWEGQDGSKKQRTEIIADTMLLLDRPPTGSTSLAPAVHAPQGDLVEQHTPPTQNVVDKGLGDQEIRLEEIPF